MSKKSQTARVYEDFQPKYEWREDQENYFLTVHLSGFTKDQVNVLCKRSTRELGLQGERRLTTNKWSRFNQDYRIPQTCDLDKLEAWWQFGVLTVTMPKEKPKTAAEEAPAPAPVPSKESVVDQPMKSSKDQSESPPKAAPVKATQKGPHHEAAEAQVGSTTSAMKPKDMHSEENRDHETATAVNGLSMENEEEEKKRIMINIGVTVLVLVALAGYLSYKLGSKAD